MPKTDSQINEDIEIFDMVERWGGWGVVAGVALEFVFAFVFGTGKSPIERWGPAVADGLIAAGIVTEIYFAKLSGDRRDERDRRSNERVAEANARADEARLETQRLRNLIGWRHIPDDAQQTTSPILRELTAQIDLLVEYQAGDPEAYTYAFEFMAAFSNGGVTRIRHCANSFIAAPVFGVWIAATDATLVEPIVTAFSGVGVSLQPFQKDLTTHLPSHMPPPNLYIFVGPKPPTVPSVTAEFIDPIIRPNP